MLFIINTRQLEKVYTDTTNRQTKREHSFLNWQFRLRKFADLSLLLFKVSSQLSKVILPLSKEIHQIKCNAKVFSYVLYPHTLRNTEIMFWTVRCRISYFLCPQACKVSESFIFNQKRWDWLEIVCFSFNLSKHFFCFYSTTDRFFSPFY